MPVTSIRGGRQISDSTIPYADIQNVTANTILGNNTASATTIQEIALATNTVLGRGGGNISALTLGTGLTISGTILQPTANLQSLAGLNYSSASFVKMTAAGTFSLDTNTYLTSAVTSVALATGTTGTDVNISGSPITSSGTITINIPSASDTARGLVTTGTQTFAGAKSFSSTFGTSVKAIVLEQNSGLVPGAGAIAMYSDSNNNLYITKSAAANAAIIAFTNTAIRTYTFQNASGTVAFLTDIPVSTGGTVTSVSGTGTVSGISLSGTVTTSGNLTLSGTLSVTPSNFANQTANTVLAGPTTGVAAAPTFRALVAADIPALSYVTSVALSLPAIFTVSGSPVTSSGTLSATLASQTANTFFAAPNGSAGSPTFRAIVAADIPALSYQAPLNGTGYVKMSGTTVSYVASIPNGDLANSSINVQGTAVSLGGSVNVINGTGFVKATGTTISYDNSTYSLSSHTHYIGTTQVQASSANQALTGITGITFVAEGSDAASITSTISSTSTFFDFNLADDNNNDEWRWRFTPSGGSVYSAMRLVPVSNTAANLIVSGTITGSQIIRSGGTSSQFLKADGSVDTNTYITGNQTITLTGNVTGSGTTSIATTIANGVVTNAMLVNSSFHVGTTSISLGRASASQTLTGVSIDGSAGTAGKLSVTSISNVSTGRTAGYLEYYDVSGATGAPTADWHSYISLRHSNSSNQHGFQLAYTFGAETLYFRGWDGTNPLTWRTMWHSGNLTNLNQLTNGPGYITSASVGNGTLTLAVSGTGLSGSASFTANQSGNTTFTVTSNATSANTASTIVARDGSGNFTAGTITASGVSTTNVYDSTGTYNVNLGSGGSEGRGLVAGYSGSSYAGIGYNVRHTTTGGSWIAPGPDTASYLLFTNGGFQFYGTGTGTGGRSISWTSLATLNSSGTFNATNVTVNGNQAWHAGNFTPGNYLPLTGGTLTGALTVGSGADLNLRATSGSDDSGDLVFQHGNGTELHRLWAGTNTLNYRTAGGTTYQLIHTGNDTDFVRTRSTVVNTTSSNFNTFTSAGTYQVAGASWTGSSNGPTNAYSYGQLAVTVNGDIVTQFYYTHNTSGHWIRSKFNASDWTDWQRVWTSANLTNLNQLANGPGYVTGGPYLPLAGGTLTGNLTAPRIILTQTGNDYYLSLNGLTITSISTGETIWRNLSSFRFTDVNDYNYDSWAGLKFINSTKQIVLGVAGNVFASNSAQTGTLLLDRISTVYVNNTSQTVLHSGNATYAWNMNQDVRTSDTVRFNQARFTSRISIGDGNGTPYLNTGSPGVWLSYNGGADIFMGAESASSWGVYIGAWRMTVNNSGTLTVGGDVIAYGTPSDARLKTIKEVIQNPIDKIKALTGYKFDWKQPDSILNIKEDIGVIAQDVAAVLPELARTNDNGYLSVRYQGLTAVLIEAVKEQQAQIEELKRQIEFLAENK